MNLDLLIDELADYALQKHAADDDEFSDDIEKQKSVDRKHKLKLALIGLGALGAGGAAAWALSGDAGKAIGNWIGGTPSKPLVAAALNPLSHGVAAGVAAGALRSPWAGRLATGVTPTGETTRGGLYTSRPPIGGGSALADAGILPASTPNRFAYDVQQLNAEYKDPTLVQRVFKPILPHEEAMAEFKGALKSYGAGPTESKSGKGTEGAPKAKDDLKAKGLTDADRPFLDGLNAKRDVAHLSETVKEFEIKGPTAMRANMSGLYVQDGGRYVPLSASQLTPDQLMRANILQGSIDEATGRFSLDPIGAKSVDLPSEIQRAARVTVDYPSMTPQRQVELFMLKQTTAPKLLEYVTQLRTDVPEQAALRQAIIGDMINTHNVGTYAETKYLPRTETVPSHDRVMNLLSDRVTQRAAFLRAAQSSMQQARYPGRPLRPVGVGVRTGATAAALSFGAQQLLGLTTGRYLDEDQ